MKALIIGAALAVVTLATAVPASAEVIVRGPGWHRPHCHTVVERHRRPNGTVVVTRRKVC